MSDNTFNAGMPLPKTFLRNDERGEDAIPQRSPRAAPKSSSETALNSFNIDSAALPDDWCTYAPTNPGMNYVQPAAESAVTKAEKAEISKKEEVRRRVFSSKIMQEYARRGVIILPQSANAQNRLSQKL